MNSRKDVSHQQEQKADQGLPAAGGREIDCGKGFKGTFGDDANVHYFHWGDSYIGSISWSMKCTLKRDAFWFM